MTVGQQWTYCQAAPTKYARESRAAPRSYTQDDEACSLRGLNLRPMAHKTIALTTELRELDHLAAKHICSRAE